MTKPATAVAIVMVLLALTGCSPTQLASSPPPPPWSQVSRNEVSGLQIPAARIDYAISKVDGLVNVPMRNSGIPGLAVAVVHKGKTVYAKGFSVKDVSRGDTPDNNVNENTVFQRASISKSVGATVVAHEVIDNEVSWDTPVVSKLVWFTLSDPYVTSHVTIADLYAHRSGWPGHAGDALEDLGYDRRQVLEHLKYLPLAPLRISYAYNNFGVTAAAETAAAAAGKSWEDLSDEVLYRPLGMASTSSRFSDFLARPNHAVNHVKVGDKWEPRFQRDADPHSDPAHARTLREYTGVYTSDYWGRAVVTEHDGALQLSLGPQNLAFTLKHWDADTFTFELSTENAPSGTVSKATFVGNTLNLEYYDSDKLGMFTR